MRTLGGAICSLDEILPSLAESLPVRVSPLRLEAIPRRTSQQPEVAISTAPLFPSVPEQCARTAPGLQLEQVKG